jgi:hypothetical protein
MTDVPPIGTREGDLEAMRRVIAAQPDLTPDEQVRVLAILDQASMELRKR